MYRNILVPMALDHGLGASTLAVARKLLEDGGTITALHVYEAPKGTVSAYLDETVVHSAFEQAKAKMQERIADTPYMTGRVIVGHSGRTIIDYAKENAIDCIVIGSHKPGLIDYFLGSTAARVVRHAPCAVHVLRTA